MASLLDLYSFTYRLVSTSNNILVMNNKCNRWINIECIQRNWGSVRWNNLKTIKTKKSFQENLKIFTILSNSFCTINFLSVLKFFSPVCYIYDIPIYTKRFARKLCDLSTVLVYFHFLKKSKDPETEIRYTTHFLCSIANGIYSGQINSIWLEEIYICF